MCYMIIFVAIENSSLVARHGGISTILHSIRECHQLPRVNESLVATVLYLINVPDTRALVRPEIDLSVRAVYCHIISSFCSVCIWYFF
jgi:hypothetical protein